MRGHFHGKIRWHPSRQRQNIKRQASECSTWNILCEASTPKLFHVEHFLRAKQNLKLFHVEHSPRVTQSSNCSTWNNLPLLARNGRGFKSGAIKHLLTFLSAVRAKSEKFSTDPSFWRAPGPHSTICAKPFYSSCLLYIRPPSQKELSTDSHSSPQRKRLSSNCPSL